MDDTRLLITGSEGRIGPILTARLADDYEIFGLDIQAPSDPQRGFKADVSSYEQVEAVFREIDPVDYVIHLAGDSRADADWDSALRFNIDGTWNVFQAAQKNGVKRVLFASSNHVTGAYEGDPPSLHTKPESVTPLTIADPIRTDGPYGISKLTGEAIARYFFDYFGLEAVCFRIGTLIADDDPSKDPRHECTWLSHRDMEHLMRRALLAEQPFPGFGVYYGISRNSRRFWSIDNAIAELGYDPQDDASAFWRGK
jgi:nucleoside-diphosphate-sugar epimerase